MAVTMKSQWGPSDDSAAIRQATTVLVWALVLLPGWAAADLSKPSIQNRYYQLQGYFGSHVLEHNETGLFDRYVEVSWSQQSVQDAAGRLWVVDRAFHQVLVLQASTRYVPFHAFYEAYAGLRGFAGHSDGSRAQTRFDSPMGIALSESANRPMVIYVSDTNNHVLRLVDFKTGRVSTLAGVVRNPGLRDGPSNRALFNGPMSLGVDAEGFNLFVLDNARRIRHVSLGQRLPPVTTLADGACRAISRWTIVGSGMLRKVGCHPDWRAKDMPDTQVDLYEFNLVCVGHEVSCGDWNRQDSSQPVATASQAPTPAPPLAPELEPGRVKPGGLMASILSGGAKN